MSAGNNQEFQVTTLDTVGPQDIRDFTGLLDTLTGAPQNPENVEANITRASESDSTTVFTIRDDESDHIVATATLNRLPVLTERGSVMWIDDVVTHPAWQGHGLSKMLMNTMEDNAAYLSDEVLLTSSPDRGPARAGYTKRGYELFPDGLKVFRNSELSIATPANTEMLTDYTSSDIEALAELTGEKPGELELKLIDVLDSVSSAVFVRRQRGALAAAAVANMCPIPVGFKPWIDDITGQDYRDKQAVVQASEHWMAQQGAPYTNIVTAFPTGLVETYAARASGLFIKRFDTA